MTNWILKTYAPKGDYATDSKARAKIGKLSGRIGIFCNVLLFAGKLTVGLLSGSVSVMADAINNLTDAASSIVTLLGFKLAEKPADSEHPYGHARYEYLSALCVAALILFIGFELAKTAIGKIFNPVAVAVSIPLGIVLLISIGIKLWMFLLNRGLGKAISSNTLLATAADSRNDAVTTLTVLAAAILEGVTHLPIDGYMSLLVSAFILYSGIQLAKETISPLLGEGVSPELRQTIVDIVTCDPRVIGYHDMLVHDYGPGQRFASIHVEMDQREDPLMCHEIIDAMERKCLSDHNVHLVIHYDPVVTDDPELNALQEEILQTLHNITPQLHIHDFRMVPGAGIKLVFFDICMPHDLKDRRHKIQKTLENALAETHQGAYGLRITFDFEG